MGGESKDVEPYTLLEPFFIGRGGARRSLAGTPVAHGRAKDDPTVAKDGGGLPD